MNENGNAGWHGWTWTSKMGEVTKGGMVCDFSPVAMFFLWNSFSLLALDLCCSSLGKVWQILPRTESFIKGIGKLTKNWKNLFLSVTSWCLRSAGKTIRDCSYILSAKFFQFPPLTPSPTALPPTTLPTLIVNLWPIWLDFRRIWNLKLLGVLNSYVVSAK